jgi:hypothetical protein
MADKATIQLTGDNKPLKTALGETKGMISEWGIAFKTQIVAIGFQVANALKNTIITGFKDSFAAAEDAQLAVTQLESQLATLGNTAALTKEEITELNERLTKTTFFDDESILRAETALLRFTKVAKEEFSRAQQAAADWASTTGQELLPVTERLGKILGEPIAAARQLREAGINMSDAQEELIKTFMETGDVASAQNIILTELENRYKGQAEALQNADGGAKELNKTIGDLQEDIGNIFLPLLKDMRPLLKDIAETIRTDVVPMFKAWVDGLRGVNSEGAKIPRWADAVADSIEKAAIDKEQQLINVGIGVLSRSGLNDEALARETAILDERQKKLNKRRDDMNRNRDTVNDMHRREDSAKRKEEEKKVAEQEAREKAEEEKRALAKEQEIGAQMDLKRKAAAKERADKLRAGQREVVVMEDAPPAWWETVGKAVFDDAKKREFKVDGFQANIEDLTGLNKRITAAAASVSPEVVRLDKLIEQGKEALANAQKNAEAIVNPLTELAKKTFGLG